MIPRKIPASDFIKRMCCGYLSRLRGNHCIVVFEGYVDDSGSSPDRNIFVLAGYISTANQWSSFSNEWELICDQEPKSPDFKMTKAFGPQYKWTPEQRDKRIADLASLVSQKAEYRIDAKVAWTDYNQIVRDKLIPEIDSPYYILFYHVILTTARFMNLAGIEGTIDWVFDEQGKIGKKVRNWYCAIRNLAPPEYQSRLGAEPIFKHDTTILPLKAADMLAWHIHRSHDQEQSHPVQLDQATTKNITALLSMPGSTCNVHAEDLVQLVRSTAATPMLRAHCGFFLPPNGGDDSGEPTSSSYSPPRPDPSC